MRDTKITLDESDIQQIQQLAETNPSHNYKIIIVQQPQTGKAISSNLRARGMKWPIEPPPVLELTSPEKSSEKWLYIHNPNWFCYAELIPTEPGKKAAQRKDTKEGSKDNLSGLLASSLHKIKNPEDRNEHGYFVFGDLNVRDAGRYKIEFTLFEMRRFDAQVYAAKIDSVISDEFEVHKKVVSNKTAVAAKDSTKLSKLLSESGIKVRLRKESTKRKQTSFNWSATQTDNLNYGSSRNYPATLAPMVNYPQPMPPPPPSFTPNTRLSRNHGEDISRRVSVVQNDMTTPGSSHSQLTSPIEGQNMGMSQTLPFHTTGGGSAPVYDYHLQHQLSPLSRGPGTLPQPQRDISGFPTHMHFQGIQNAAQPQPWNFQGQGSFRPDPPHEQSQYYGGQQLPDPRTNQERGDSGYSSHGRPSISHMDSGHSEGFNPRSHPYGQQVLPGIHSHPGEGINQQEWQMSTSIQNFSGYESVSSGRSSEMGQPHQGIPLGYVFTTPAGSSMFEHSLPQTSHP